VAFDFCSSQAHSGAFAVDSDASPNKSQKLGLHVSATSAGYIRRHDMAKPTTIKIKKYDPVARKHVEYKEGKIK